jgi:TP901 family phage tail tape measure protein
MPEYKNQLLVSFSGKVDASFKNSIKEVSASLSALGKGGGKKPLADISSGAKNAGNSMGFLSGATNSVVGAFKTLTRFAVAGAIFKAITNAVVGSTKAIIEYDQALKNLQAITNATNMEVAAFGDKLFEVSNNTKFSANEVAQAMVYLGQSGFTAAESLASIDAIASVATGTLSDFATTADLFTSTLRAFQLEASESGRVADIFASAVNKSKLTIQGLRTILNYAGASAKQAGVSLEEMATAAGLLANNGMRMSTVGTSMRNVISRMIAPNTKLKKALSELNLSIDEINPNMVGFKVAMNNMTRILKNNRRGIIDAGTAYELFGLRGQQAATIFAKSFSGPDFDRLLDNIKKPGEALRQQLKQQEGLGVQTKNLMDRLKNLGITLGEAGLTRAIRGVVEALSWMVLKLQDAVKWYTKWYDKVFGNTETATKNVIREAEAYKNAAHDIGRYIEVIKNISESDKDDWEKKKELTQVVEVLSAQYEDLAEALGYADGNAQKLIKTLDDYTKKAKADEGLLLRRSLNESDKAIEYSKNKIEELKKEVEKYSNTTGRSTRTSSYIQFELQRYQKELENELKNLGELETQRLNFAEKIKNLEKRDEESLDPDSARGASSRINKRQQAEAQRIQAIKDNWATTIKELGGSWETLANKIFKGGNYDQIMLLVDAMAKAKTDANEAITKLEKASVPPSKYDEEKIKAAAIKAAYKKLQEDLRKENEQVIRDEENSYKQREQALKNSLAASLENEKANLENKKALLTADGGTQRDIIKAEKESIDKRIEITNDGYKDLIEKAEEFNKKKKALGGTVDDSNITNLEAQRDKALAKFNVELAKNEKKLQKDRLENPQNFEEAWTSALDKIKKASQTTWKDISNYVSDFVIDFADSTADAFVDFVNGTKTAAEAFGDMATSILADITKMIIKQQILNAIMAGAGALSSSGGILGGIGNLLSGAISSNHSGGLAGKASSIKKNLSPMAFIQAPRFHDGGEVPAVLQRGEVVQTREQAAQSREPKNVSVIIENKTGTQVGRAKATSSMDMGQEVIRIVLDGIDRNVNGLRTVVASTK